MGAGHWYVPERRYQENITEADRGYGRQFASGPGGWGPAVSWPYAPMKHLRSRTLDLIRGHKCVPISNPFSALGDHVEENSENYEKTQENSENTKKIAINEIIESEAQAYPTSNGVLTIATINIYGLAGKVEPLMSWIKRNNVDLCVVQETWTKEGHTRRLLGEAVVACHEYPRRLQVGHAKYGLAVLRNTDTTSSTDFELVAEDEAPEGQAK